MYKCKKFNEKINELKTHAYKKIVQENTFLTFFLFIKLYMLNKDKTKKKDNKIATLKINQLKIIKHILSTL
jgi:hypothetical protein